jgi:succinate dehydrogenase / fumarate reductase cytochrome b subunit
MAESNRPLSPHLTVYRWQISNTLSIIHRATGVMLALGAAIMTLWLVGIASGPDAYLAVLGWLGSPLGLLLLFGWSFCFFYHLANGVRHLFWDAGYGFELPRAHATGIAVIIAASVLTVLFWALAISRGGA